MGVINKLYLLSYNVFALLAWVWVAQICITHVLAHGLTNFNIFYNNVSFALQIAQTVAVLEIVNAGFGYVKSSWMTTSIQVFSRLHVVWIIFIVNPATHDFLYTFTCIFAWSIAEIIRYPFYALAVFDINIKPLTILRYSGFLVLYPLGIFSEVRCILHSLPVFRDETSKRLWPSAMPNTANFQVDLYITYLIVLASYIPGSFVMFTHMMAQRTKVIKKLRQPKEKSE